MSRALALVAFVVLVLVPAGSATTAWNAAGTGTAKARAGSLDTPSPSVGPVTCSSLKQQATVSWSAITGASGYDVEITASGSGATQTTSTTSTSATLTAGLLSNGNVVTTTYRVRVRATAGAWTGSWGGPVSVTLGVCVG